MTLRLRFAVLLLSTALALPAASAQPAPTQADRPLATLSPDELEVLGPLLRTGTVSLVEFAMDGELPAVVIATEVDASPATLAAVVGDPRHYPDFMPALDAVNVHAEDAAQLSYSWAWETSLFTLRGDHAMQRFAPPEGHPEQGYRFVIRSTGGDLGVGRTVWRILPRGQGRSLLMSSCRMDFQDANYIARQLASTGPSLSRTVNIALGFATVLRARMEAERREGRVRTAVPRPGSEPARPAMDPLALERLVGRGDVMWVETTGTDLGRVMVLGAMHTPEGVTRTAMLDPAGFTQGFLQGARATVLERSPTETRFDWGIDLPLVGTSGQMLLRDTPGGRIQLDGVHGSLADARFRFETIARPYGTLVVTWGRFDPSEGFWLLRVVTNADAAFRPGLAGAAQLMLIRGLRTRLIRGV